MLRGGAGDDRLSSGSGSDVLRGDMDDDRLSSGPGSDVLRGNDGLDRCAGGAGTDRVRCEMTTSAEVVRYAAVTGVGGR